MTPTFPTNSTVGQRGLAASLTLINANTGTDTTATICNNADPSPSCPVNTEGITLMGSCGRQGPDAACDRADPAVFGISSSATGGAGTCAGRAFTVATIASDPYGKVRLTPTDGGHVVLPAPGDLCRIDFTVDVLRAPTIDAQPGVDSVQTIQVADASQYSINATAGFARGSQTGATVNPPPPPPPPAEPPPPALPLLPSDVCVPPPGPAPPGGRLCETPQRGSAAIVGRTGCVGTPFNVQVHGRAIRRVVFVLDGRRVRTLTRPNLGQRYVLPINPSRMRRGVHRVTATTTFTPASNTRARTLRVVFQRCSRRAAAPAFTG